MSEGTTGMELSSTVLKRKDKEIEEVLASSSHVCLYNMPIETQTWEKRDVEGPLFLVKRKSHPRFQLIVMSKTRTGLFTEDVHGGLDFEISSPYLMYTHGDSEITGIWFYVQADLEILGNLLAKIKATLPKPDPPPAAITAAPDGGASGSATAADPFWDRAAVVPAVVPPKADMPAPSPPPPQPVAAPAASSGLAGLFGAGATQEGGGAAGAGNNALVALFKQAQLRQGATASGSASPAVPPPAPEPTAQPALLPPSFFGASTAPRTATPPAAPAPAVISPLAAPAAVAADNSLARFFNKTAGTALPPAAATAATAASSVAKPSPQPHASSPNRTRHHNQPPPPQPPPAQPPAHAAVNGYLRPDASAANANAAAAAKQHVSHHHQHPQQQQHHQQMQQQYQQHQQRAPLAPAAPLAQRALLRQAATQLLQQDAFVDMLLAEMRGVGLLP